MGHLEWCISRVEAWSTDKIPNFSNELLEVHGSIQVLQRIVHETAINSGWWDEKDFNVGEKIALMHSELSEALEAFRKGVQPCDKPIPVNNVEEEFADVIIRILDLAGKMNLDIASALLYKSEYNKTRGYKHGGKNF